jgi:hypothetical protein
MTMALFLVLCCVGAVGATGLGILIVRRFIHHHVAEGHNDVLVPIFLTTGTIYAVFLAFIVVAVREDYGIAHTNIADEASALTTIYRASTGMDKATGDELRGLVRDYTEAVVQDEWKIQAETGGARTMSLLIALLLSITALSSHPFNGPMALAPEPFEHSLSVYQSVDKTP